MEDEDKEAIINEGLIRTVNLKKAFGYIEWQLSGARAAKVEQNSKGKIEIKFSNKYLEDKYKHTINIPDDLDWMLKFTNNLGYYPTQTYLYSNYLRPTNYDEKEIKNIVSKKPADLYSIVFDAKFPPAVDEDSVPDKLYHISDGSVKDKILQKGLSPKTSNKIESHPERVYFCPTEECIKELIKNKKFSRTSTSDEYCLLQIDTTKIKNSVDFYPDPSHKGALFIYGNIHPKHIKLLQTHKKQK